MGNPSVKLVDIHLVVGWVEMVEYVDREVVVLGDEGKSAWLPRGRHVEEMPPTYCMEWLTWPDSVTTAC